MFRLGYQARAGATTKVVSFGEEAEQEVAGQRDCKIELILFLWVSGSAVIFNIYYWSTY